MRRRLLSWLLWKDPSREREVTERLRHAEEEERCALARHTKTAIGNTIRSDDTVAAMDALLDKMNRRGGEHGHSG